MRENSMRWTVAWSPASKLVSTRLQSNQNIDEVNSAPARAAMGILNACMRMASCVLD
jgi:hypothetical protein